MLNGVPRCGKTSIAQAMQARSTSGWLNLGVDAAAEWLPRSLRPGIGLRPGGERPDLEDAVLALYRGLFDSVAAHARQGLDVVVDVGLHESYSRPLRVGTECARRLAGLPVLFVGVHCPPDVVWRRRAATWGQDASTADRALRDAVTRWQAAVHRFPYDLEVDTSELSATDCADRVLTRLRDGPAGRALGALVPA